MTDEALRGKLWAMYTLEEDFTLNGYVCEAVDPFTGEAIAASGSYRAGAAAAAVARGRSRRAYRTGSAALSLRPLAEGRCGGGLISVSFWAYNAIRSSTLPEHYVGGVFNRSGASVARRVGIFVPGQAIRCSRVTATVVGDRSVEYNGEIMSLTALAKLLTGKQYSIAGPKYFKYKGEWLNDIRHRLGVYGINDSPQIKR